jgi:hypothetical protein
LNGGVRFLEGAKMFLRSAFWLCVGFALVAPHGTDFGAAAAQMRDQAMQAGTQTVAQIVVDQALNESTLKNIGAKLVSSSPSVVHPSQDLPVASFVFPRPRPLAMG